MGDETGITKIVAWWGAVVATVVLLWDIYKWNKSGPNLQLSASPNMQVLGDEGLEGPSYIFLEVSNVGDRKTTLTHFVGKWYKSFWQRIRRKKAEANFMVPNPEYSKPLPFILEAGESWTGYVRQTEELEGWMKTGRLFLGVAYTNKVKPKYLRIRYKVHNKDSRN